MKLGIIGLPGAGKTTIFNALTQGNAPTGQSVGGRFEVLTAVVEVADERVDILSRAYEPQKTTRARITYTDIAGLQTGMGASGGIGGPILNHLAGLDGFVHVIRHFEDELLPHPEGTVDAQRDRDGLDTELLINDLVVIERRIDKLKEGLSKGAVKDRVAGQSELALLERMGDALSAELPLRDLELTDDELKAVRNYAFLTLKPQLIIVNLGEDQAELDLDGRYQRTLVANVRGKLEMELAQLSQEGDEEALAMFMEEYGVQELGMDRAIRLSFELMGLLSFFTVSEDEVRAWTIRRGATALEAAATIHTDLAKGFIRAETCQFEDFRELGSLAQIRSAGKLRQEGKTYVVQDGDILRIKFNL